MGKQVRQFFPTDAQRAGVLADLAYEIEQMIFSLEQHVGLGAGPDANQPIVAGIRNGLLESALLHARALLDFFEREERAQSRGIELDDVLSRDFGVPSAPIPIPADLRERLNKDLAHLTYSRVDRTEETKKWRIREMMEPLVMRCLDMANQVVVPPTRRLLDGGPALAKWHDLQAALRERLGR